ncbi:MAG: exopolygalacturonase, partial [Bacteroidales bacterium]|nr:exopolygalacturonase [Bacteroidales bacterium]
MKKYAAILLILSVITLNAQERWPDGSAVGKWFRESPKPVRCGQARRFVITDYGAGEDSTAVQTAAIQRAIDAAARRGGTVVIPRGTWLSGALFFKPKTHLYLEEGAVLKGSTDTWDFPDTPVHIEGVLQPYAAALINADKCNGFSIRGEGTLDGNGLPYWEAFWARRKENPQCTNLEVRRPRMIGISNSRNVTIEGVRLRNSAFWNVHLYKCSKVYISGVSIYAPIKPVKAPSSDGIDLDACTDVHILGCDFATGDDLIALKGGKGPWADEDPDNGTNARILVEDCNFGHGPGVLVFGSECIGADNVILRNSKVSKTDRLLWLKMRPDTPQRYSHIRVEDVSGDVKNVVYIKP